MKFEILIFVIFRLNLIQINFVEVLEVTSSLIVITLQISAPPEALCCPLQGPAPHFENRNTNRNAFHKDWPLFISNTSESLHFLLLFRAKYLVHVDRY